MDLRGGQLDADRMRELLSRISCPLCGGTRDDSLLVVVDQPAAGASVRAQCVRCHLYWSFTLDAELGPTAPVATRVPHRMPDTPISADEVLALREMLDSHSGGFVELFWRRAG